MTNTDIVSTPANAVSAQLYFEWCILFMLSDILVWIMHWFCLYWIVWPTTLQWWHRNISTLSAKHHIPTLLENDLNYSAVAINKISTIELRTNFMQKKCTFLLHDAMHKWSMLLCGVCTSVCPSRSFVYSVETHLNKHSHTILVFPYQTLWQYSDGYAHNEGVKRRCGKQKS